MDRTVLVVGGGLAGARTVEALRELGHDGPLVLVGDEAELPYQRPPLSKDYLHGRSAFDDAVVHPQEWYDDNRVDVRTGAHVRSLDAAAHLATMDDGSTIRFDSAVLATGSAPRALTLPGGEAALLLRTRQDSDRLRSELGERPRVVIVGSGWIGLEVAAAAVAAGCEVTVVERGALPLEHVLGPEMGGVFASLHRDHGVNLLVRRELDEIVLDGSGRVSAVRLSDGRVLEADLVVAGVGVEPRQSLAAGAGLTVTEGVVVDEHLRTSHPDVFAVGDVALAYHPFAGKHVRIEHWANAEHQPAVAAASLLGMERRYDRLPYFFSDQFELSMELTGFVEPGGYDDLVVRGDVSSLTFATFWIRHGRVVAGMAAGMPGVIAQTDRLIRSRTDVRSDELRDGGSALSEIADRRSA
ncbi:MAG TPA: FAD-dependent oxidoreductase [Candidatus Nanopelagicales bacterium]|nr:FAD-dependent oxidoreductase [Candidatus Nanopelagicales bacterium]